MSVKFIQGTVQSSDNKYVQYRLMVQNFTTDVTQWQGVDIKPVPNSKNFVESDSLSRNPYFHNIQQGSISADNGTESASNIRVRTSLIEAHPYMKVSVPTGFQIVRIFYYSKDGSYINAIVINSASLTIPERNDLSYFRLVVSKTDTSATVVPSEVSISVSSAIGEEIIKAQNYSRSILDSALGVSSYSEHDGYLKSNGTFDGISTKHCLVTNKFSCNPGDIFLYKGKGTGDAVAALFYNDDTITGNYKIESLTDYAEITIPNNTDFVVFSANAAKTADVILSVYLKTKVIQKLLTVDNVVYKEKTPNLFNPNIREAGYLTNNGILDGGSPYYTTDYLSIAQGEKYYITGFRKLAFYDTSKVHQSAYFVDGGENYVFTAPINGFIRFSYRTDFAYYNTLMYGVGDAIPDHYIPYGEMIQEGIHASETIINEVLGRSNEQLQAVLTGKTIAQFGDSIMAGDGASNLGIGERFAQKYGVTCLEYAVGGATMGYLDAQHSHIIDQVNLAIGNSIEPDIILIDGGTNDMNGTIPNCPLGDISDVYTEPSASDDFSNGFESVAYKIKSTWPDAIVIFIRAHNMSSRLYDRQISYGERGIKIAEKWGFYTIDIYKIMNTQLSYFQTKYLSDTTHPNALGYETYYIPALEQFFYEKRNLL